MAWTSPRTWTTGELVTASMMNTHVRDNLLETAVSKATTSGRIAYATGANALAENANITVTSGGQVKTKNPACRAYNSANVALTATTWTTITLNSERFDNDTIHDTSSNTSRLTCKTAGVYVITATIQTDSALGRYVGVRFFLNGATTIAYTSNFYQHTTADANNLSALSTVYKLAVNDYVEVQVWVENSSLNAIASGNGSPEFGMAYVSDG